MFPDSSMDGKRVRTAGLARQEDEQPPEFLLPCQWFGAHGSSDHPCLFRQSSLRTGGPGNTVRGQADRLLTLWRSPCCEEDNPTCHFIDHFKVMMSSFILSPWTLFILLIFWVLVAFNTVARSPHLAPDSLAPPFSLLGVLLCFCPPGDVEVPHVLSGVTFCYASALDLRGHGTPPPPSEPRWPSSC